MLIAGGATSVESCAVDAANNSLYAHAGFANSPSWKLLNPDVAFVDNGLDTVETNSALVEYAALQIGLNSIVRN